MLKQRWSSSEREESWPQEDIAVSISSLMLRRSCHTYGALKQNLLMFMPDTVFISFVLLDITYIYSLMFISDCHIWSRLLTDRQQTPVPKDVAITFNGTSPQKSAHQKYSKTPKNLVRNPEIPLCFSSAVRSG